MPNTVTYTAYNGQQFYCRKAADGSSASGANQPDQSIVGFITHHPDGRQITDFLQSNFLEPEGVVNAFNACGKNGVDVWAELIAKYKEVNAWQAYKLMLRAPLPKATVKSLASNAPVGSFMTPLAAAPVNAEPGSIAVANGTTWQPDAKGWGIFRLDATLGWIRLV